VQLLGYATLAAHKLDARENTVDAIGFHLQSVSYLLDSNIATAKAQNLDRQRLKNNAQL
jgi:hypothetical protein